ncbi:MAG: sugar ABC transporter ATP-binding protein, partial [Candidatus Nanopelagicaceae bacterium]|nr:sugar ABC transporter ATP-binding protein [Candidatus Nanopelagicaceae bacterium]
MAEPILSLRNLNKSFGPVHVLKDVNFNAYAGQVTALVGDNGAGKSTLIKCIAGIYTPESGDFIFEGKPVQISGPRDATALGIEIVYQDLALCDNLDIVHNMFLGREEKSGLTLNESAMESLAKKTLDGLSVRTVKSIRQKVASLSGGQRQTVAIARAVLWNSKV